MKHRLVALMTAVGVVGFAPVGLAADDDESPLAHEMDEMDGALKKLRRLKRDPERWKKSAEAIRIGAEHCIKALPMIPAEVEALPDGPEKLKAIADTRRLMGLTLALYAELELAFLAEDEDKADEIIDKLKDLKEEGHEKYYKEE